MDLMEYYNGAYKIVNEKEMETFLRRLNGTTIKGTVKDGYLYEDEYTCFSFFKDKPNATLNNWIEWKHVTKMYGVRIKGEIKPTTEGITFRNCVLEEY